jgi:hypothetical protein
LNFLENGISVICSGLSPRSELTETRLRRQLSDKPV